ncbi:hypothetical protein V9T40_008694 [Parthenolecanium corni]|uniref:Uncharacterized protein n=1 Tax=Parthenolecanium corni TaxID=536013 RepID=A0AAN9U080_9HEMI
MINFNHLFSEFCSMARALKKQIYTRFEIRKKRVAVPNAEASLCGLPPPPPPPPPPRILFQSWANLCNKYMPANPSNSSNANLMKCMCAFTKLLRTSTNMVTVVDFHIDIVVTINYKNHYESCEK